MQLEFTNHARRRMIQRSISEADVRAVLTGPHQTGRSDRDPKLQPRDRPGR